MHMHQLDTLYQSNGCENSSGVTEVKRSFSQKNAVTRPLYIARPYDSNMYISLRPSTYVYGVIGQPGVIWGHRGQTLIFTKKCIISSMLRTLSM